MNELKQAIYKKILDLVKSKKKVVLAWDGGPYTGLIWWIAYKDLGIELPMVFLDNNQYTPAMYTFIHATMRKYSLKATIVVCEDIAAGMTQLNKDFEVVLTKAFLPDGLETWNLLKLLGVPYFEERKGVLQ